MYWLQVPLETLKRDEDWYLWQPAVIVCSRRHHVLLMDLVFSLSRRVKMHFKCWRSIILDHPDLLVLFLSMTRWFSIISSQATSLKKTTILSWLKTSRQERFLHGPARIFITVGIDSYPFERLHACSHSLFPINSLVASQANIHKLAMQCRKWFFVCWMFIYMFWFPINPGH